MLNRSVAGCGRLWKPALACAAIGLALLAFPAAPAQARRHHHHGIHRYHGEEHPWRHALFRRHGRRHGAEARPGASAETPAFAAIVVDANSGRTLYARNPDELRHPASVTKVMTLYLLFEQLERGRFRLDSPLEISPHAAAQAPSKLGLAPGQTIDVENAIKAVVTKSANDIAAAIAENIAGDEERFAEMMTRKAHALGMSRTHYANASGLPDSEQITTARDLTILGRAVQERFPAYYRYFSTPVFFYHGQAHRNHNHLLGRIDGIDGIKTGYTRASGFNLLTSVRRGGRRIVAVVMGGPTAAARDRTMARLIADYVPEGSPLRTAPAIAEDSPAEAVASAEGDEQEAAPAAPAVAPAVPAPPQPQAKERGEKIRPAFVPGGQMRAEAPMAPQAPHGQVRSSADGSTSHAGARGARDSAPVTPSAVQRGVGLDHASGRSDTAESVKVQFGRPARAGWMIQIGAAEDAGKAEELLARARARGVPATAKAFTEKIQKGGETLWRARFAGLEEKSAESTCRALKRSGFSCFATRN